MSEEKRERIRKILGKYADMKPEDGETWESWYVAANDLMGQEIGIALEVADAAQPVARVPEDEADGYLVVSVKGLQELDTALDRADFKGYLPEDIAQAWYNLDWRSVAPQAPAVRVDLCDLRRRIAAAPRRQFESAKGVYTSWLDQGSVLDLLDAHIEKAPAASAEQTGTSHMGRVPESRKPFRCDMSAVAKAPALSASEQHARSTVRVCEVSDAQCSRGCGTGLCASEQQSAYETLERHRIAGGYVPNDVRTVPALNANQCVLPELKTTGEPTQKPDGLAWALAALQAVDSERTEEDADVHDQNSAATQAINDRILAIAEDAPDPCRTILRNLIEFIDKEGPEAKQWEPISKLCERGWQALDGDHTAADGIPRAAEDAGGDEIELATFEFDLKTFEASLRGLVEHSREWEKAYHDGSKLYEELDPYKSTVEQELRYLVKQFREQLEREASTLRQFRRYAAIHPAPANKAVGLTDERILEVLQSVRPSAVRFPPWFKAFASALLAAAQPSAGEQPSLTNPLTPYGMLVRALRIVAGTTLYDMAKHFAGGPARLSAIEFGRMTATEAVVARTAEYFAGLGIHDTLPALNAALLAAAPAEEKGEPT